MKLLADWQTKSIGVSHKGWVYYVAWTHPDVRKLGEEIDWFDGPLYRFGFWYLSFHAHHDRTNYDKKGKKQNKKV